MLHSVNVTMYSFLEQRRFFGTILPYKKDLLKPAIHIMLFIFKTCSLLIKNSDLKALIRPNKMNLTLVELLFGCAVPIVHPVSRPPTKMTDVKNINKKINALKIFSSETAEPIKTKLK